jgi:hypothetical protein
MNVKDTAAACNAAIVISRGGLRGFAPVNRERPNESVASGRSVLFDDLESAGGNRGLYEDFLLSSCVCGGGIASSWLFRVNGARGKQRAQKCLRLTR